MAVVFIHSYMAPLIQLLPNSQKMPMKIIYMKLCLAGSHETGIMFSTGFFLNLTAICALDGTAFHYQLKQMIGLLDSFLGQLLICCRNDYRFL